jgi:hypothetical protein
MIGRPLRPSTVTSSRVSFDSLNSVPASVLAGSRGLPALGVSTEPARGVETLRRLPDEMNWLVTDCFTRRSTASLRRSHCLRSRLRVRAHGCVRG